MSLKATAALTALLLTLGLAAWLLVPDSQTPASAWPTAVGGSAERACGKLMAGGYDVDTRGVGALLRDVESSEDVLLAGYAHQANQALLDALTGRGSESLARTRLLIVETACETTYGRPT